MKYIASIVGVVAACLLSSCANEELEAAKRNLEIAAADHDHYKVIQYSAVVLEHDPENIKAISEMRNSTRIFTKLEELAESLAGLQELDLEPAEKFGDGYLEGENATENRAKKVFLEFCNLHFLDHFKAWSGVDSCESSEALQASKNIVLGLDDEVQKADSDIYIESATKMLRFESTLSLSPEITKLKSNAQTLETAMDLLEEVKELDPRFLGLGEIENFLETKALETLTVSNMFVIANDSMVKLAVTLQDTLASVTESKYDALNSMSQYGISISMSEAFSFAEVDVVYKDVTVPVILEAWEEMSTDVLSAYKDLHGTFDFDQLEEGIGLLEASMTLFELSSSPSGSLRDWNRGTSEAVGQYNDFSTAWVNELEDIKLPKTNIESTDGIAPPKYREAINSASGLLNI